MERNSSKWHIRAAQTERSIYQNTEGKPPVGETTIAKNDEGAAPDSVDDHADSTRRGQTVVETYFAGSDSGAYQGINFATLLPKTGKADVIIVGQTGFGKAAPQRFETNVKFRASDNHQLRLNTSVCRLGIIRNGYKEDPLGQ